MHEACPTCHRAYAPAPKRVCAKCGGPILTKATGQAKHGLARLKDHWEREH